MGSPLLKPACFIYLYCPAPSKAETLEDQWSVVSDQWSEKHRAVASSQKNRPNAIEHLSLEDPIT
jgi:hypothetical protein